MTREEAQEVLLLFRPGTADAEEPQIIAAMEVARRDPELGQWFEQHQRFQATMRAGFRRIGAPEHLKVALLAAQKTQAEMSRSLPAESEAVAGTTGRRAPSPWWAKFWPAMGRPSRAWWQQPLWLSTSAAMVILTGLVLFWPKTNIPDRFADYRAMMVSKAKRDYNMDWATDNMKQLRQRFGEKAAPADYHLTPGLEGLHLTGGARLTWRGNPVAMVCFLSGTNQKFWLFVMKSEALKDAPGQAPKMDGLLSGLLTASWTRGGDIYLVVGPDEADFARKYLPEL
jgi:hypothetical protein